MYFLKICFVEILYSFPNKVYQLSVYKQCKNNFYFSGLWKMIYFPKSSLILEINIFLLFSCDDKDQSTQHFSEKSSSRHAENCFLLLLEGCPPLCQWFIEMT